MLKDRLDNYLGRKELSKKATAEVVAILAEHEYSSNEAIEELVEVLFSLKADVIYNFICKQLEKIAVEFKGVFWEQCQKAINPNKFTHSFLLAVAFCKQSQKSDANAVISWVVKKYILVQKVNKQVYASFERAIHYDGAESLFEKWVGDEERTKNGYRKLLMEFLKIFPKPEYAELVIKWYNANEITIHSPEQEVISVALQQQEAQTVSTKDSKNTTVQAKHDESLDLSRFPLAELLAAVNARCLSLSKKVDELEAENTNLKETEKLLTDKLNASELSLKSADIKIKSLKETVKTRECTIDALNKDLDISRKKINGLNKNIEELNGKLSNVESAYGQAGQQEIDFLKGQIKKRLSSEYAKYLELKEKDPDLDYYIILLDMLDEIYHVLNKNGIKFD